MSEPLTASLALRRIAACLTIVPALISAVVTRFASEMRWALKFCWWDAQAEIDSFKAHWRGEKP